MLVHMLYAKSQCSIFADGYREIVLGESFDKCNAVGANKKRHGPGGGCRWGVMVREPEGFEMFTTSRSEKLSSIGC